MSLEDIEKEKQIQDSMIQLLPKDLQGKVKDGTYYFVGNMEGSTQQLLTIVEIKDSNIVKYMLLDALILYQYLDTNKKSFLPVSKKPEFGVV